MLAPDQRPALHVMAAVIRGRDGRVLIAKRLAHSDQGGLWEFPGGKLEAGEARLDGLRRELEEELGIVVRTAAPMLQVTHAYPHRRVLLDIFEVTDWLGTAHGREGQPLVWVMPDDLPRYAFPAANVPIIAAARLPRLCLVTPEPTDIESWLAALAAALRSGIRLVQLRAKNLDAADYLALAKRVVPLVQAAGAKVLLNADPSLVAMTGADGVHLDAGRLHALAARPFDSPGLVTAVCHGEADLTKAQALGVDALLISPVAKTTSHPEACPLGFERLAELARRANVASYALGGMTPADLPPAIEAGCMGIAAISGLWGPLAP